MGAVLAMITWKAALAVGAAVLAGCAGGSGQQNGQSQLLRQALSGLFAGRGGGEGQAQVAVQQNLRQTLTREAISQSPTSLMLAEIPARAGQAVVAPVLANGDRLTWGTNDGITLTLQDGLVVGTRGLGGDMMGAEVRGTRAALRSGGTSVRIHDLIGGEDQVERLSYQCDVVVAGQERIGIFGRAFDTTKVVETCRGAELAFENAYWVEGNGRIRKSRQWISADVQYLLLERLD